MDINMCFGPHRFLRSQDLPKPLLLTIEAFTEESLIPGPAGSKLVVWFRELDRGLVLNRTNARAIAQILQSSESDDWLGRRIVLFCDEAASFHGSKGGIRVRAPTQDEVALNPPHE